MYLTLLFYWTFSYKTFNIIFIDIFYLIMICEKSSILYENELENKYRQDWVPQKI